jgi:hypothetical protein
LKKIAQFFEIVAKKCQIIHIKGQLESKNISIKPLLKHTTNHILKLLGENVNILRKKKVTPNVTISWGYFIFSKNHNAIKK